MICSTLKSLFQPAHRLLFCSWLHSLEHSGQKLIKNVFKVIDHVWRSDRIDSKFPKLRLLGFWWVFLSFELFSSVFTLFFSILCRNCSHCPSYKVIKAKLIYNLTTLIRIYEFIFLIVSKKVNFSIINLHNLYISLLFICVVCC